MGGFDRSRDKLELDYVVKGLKAGGGAANRMGEKENLRFMTGEPGSAYEEGAELAGEEVLIGFEIPSELLGGALDEAEGECFKAFGDGFVGSKNGAYV